MYDGVVVCLMIELTVAEVANVAVEVAALVAFVNPVVLNLQLYIPGVRFQESLVLVGRQFQDYKFLL